MKYIVYAKITVGCRTIVEAKNEKEAIKRAEDMPLAEIISDGYYIPEDYWVVEELDGTPFDLYIDNLNI